MLNQSFYTFCCTQLQIKVHNLLHSDWSGVVQISAVRKTKLLLQMFKLHFQEESMCSFFPTTGLFEPYMQLQFLEYKMLC
jgi:hypothetical protein